MSDDQLLKKLRRKYRHHDTSNFTIEDFVGAFGSPLDALAYARIFWPLFVEHEGMVFLKERFEEEEAVAVVAEVLRKNNDDRTKTEQAFNLVEIPSGIFGRSAAETTDDEDRCLASILAEMWAARLSGLYPNRVFVVDLVEPEQTGGEIAIRFYQRT